MGARFWAAVLLALTAPVAARAASYNVNLPCAPVHHLIARNGKVMLVACVNRKTGFKIDFLDLPSGHVLRSIAPGDNIDGVALSNDGRRLAIGWSSGRISVFSTRDKNVDTFKAAPDPEALNFLGDDRLIVASTLWDVSGKRPLHAFKTDFGPVNVVARSADGTQLATGGGDTVVRLYNAHSWKLTHRDPRSNKPVGWRFTNLNTGTSEPACEGADALGVSESAVWCFKIKGKTLVANAAAPPNK
jgi:WD40 repeat protein